MAFSKRHLVFVAPALFAELAAIPATVILGHVYIAFSTIAGLPAPGISWWVWLLFFVVLRVALTVSSLLTVRSSRWWLSGLAGMWQIWMFSGLASGYALLLSVLHDQTGGASLHTIPWYMWLPHSAVVLIPIIVTPIVILHGFRVHGGYYLRDSPA